MSRHDDEQQVTETGAPRMRPSEIPRPLRHSVYLMDWSLTANRASRMQNSFGSSSHKSVPRSKSTSPKRSTM